MTRRLAATWSLGAVLLLTVVRCTPPARSDDEGASERAASQAADVPGGLTGERGTAVDGMASEDTLRSRLPGMLRTVEGTPVVGWTGPGGEPFEVTIRTADPTTNMRRFGSITLRTSARTRSPDLGQYPCTSCHLGRGMVLRDERIADAHQNIQPLHPAQTGATCSTCHAPDNVERLALRSGDRATLDHAYRLCAQCHFQQVESWAGGAHGKRLDGWQGRRVVMGCADCHDPHRPALATRIPFRGPTLQRPALRRP